MSVKSGSARRALGALGLLLMVALTAVASGSAARTPAQLEGGLVSTRWKPGMLRSGATNVVVQLAGSPVVVQEDQAGRSFGSAEKQAAKDALAASQNAIRGQIEALGGKVTADYQAGVQRSQGEHRASASLPRSPHLPQTSSASTGCRR